jgi:transmembrane sensor
MSSAKIKLSNLMRATQAGTPDDDAAWRRMRRGLDERRAARARRRMFFIPTLSLATAAAIGAVWYVRREPAPGQDVAAIAGRAFESSSNEVALALPDGVHVDMGPHSRVAVEEVTAEQIRVGLGHGHALFDVEPHRHRRFIVDVGDVEVRVVGTRFRVDRLAGAQGQADGDGARVEVAVERGIVEVRNRNGGEVHRLHAGERYSALIATATEAAQTPDEAPALDDAPERQHVRHGRSHAAHEEARMLLERAQGQWRTGHMAEAAGLYEEILSRYPHDARTGLAALELGRIQMDHLGDLKGAVTSLQRAVRLAPAASFHEDALARLVQATDRLGRRGDCARARDAYLARYHDGIHAAAVSKACE